MRRLTLRSNQWIALEPAEPHDCPYLPDRTAGLAAGLIVPDGPTFDRLLASGFRRLGSVFYRPDCGGCRECIPIRVPLQSLVHSRSQRRLWRRAGPRYQVVVRPALYCREHFDLHRLHSEHVSADNPPTTPDAYRACFVISAVTTHFVEYRVDGQLVAVSVLDESQDALSSVYVSWDPAFGRLSPGTFSALWEMRWAREQGKRYYYLGYWIAACQPMRYKSRFRPCELMSWDSRRWQPHTSA